MRKSKTAARLKNKHIKTLERRNLREQAKVELTAQVPVLVCDDPEMVKVFDTGDVTFANGCQWPVFGEGKRSRDFVKWFCNDKKSRGSVYCDMHSRQAYNPGFNRKEAA